MQDDTECSKVYANCLNLSQQSSRAELALMKVILQFCVNSQHWWLNSYRKTPFAWHINKLDNKIWNKTKSKEANLQNLRWWGYFNANALWQHLWLQQIMLNCNDCRWLATFKNMLLNSRKKTSQQFKIKFSSLDQKWQGCIAAELV